MKLLFLGTGAAGSVKRDEADISEGIRRCTTVMIDGTVLVDVSRQSFDYQTKLGKDPAQITDIFLSHSHGDHFNRNALMKYAQATGGKVRFWCHKGALENLKFTEEELQNFILCPVEICDTWQTAGMTVTALPANHLVGSFTSAEKPLHYIFEKDGKKFYYGCDGGWYTAIEWEYMMQNKIRLDGVLLDATVGEDDGNFRIATHNNLAMIKLLTLALKQNNLLNENAKLITTHFANSCYDGSRTKEEVFSPMGILPTEDGMELEI